MKKASNIIFSILFLGFIAGMGMFTVFTPDVATSETENRTLTIRPELQKSTIVTGQFTEEYDEYITDQFPLRDQWINRYLDWQIFTNQTFIHDYYLAGDWVYPRPFTEIDQVVIDYATKQMTELNTFSKHHDIELYFFSLPDRRYMIDMEFPKRVENKVLREDKETLLSQFPESPMHIVDIGENWERERDEENYRDYYFRTDHHWNMDGALLAYEEIHDTLYETSEVLMDAPFDKINYEKECVPNKQFLGSYNRQLYGYIDATSEDMCYYFLKSNHLDEWSVYVQELDQKNDVPFTAVYGSARETNEEVIAYADLYGFDRDETHIINPAKQGKVLVLKDSYANPLIPLLADNFYQTTFYDVRHNEGRNLYDYILDHDFDAVLFLYSNGRTLDYLYDFGELEHSMLEN